MKLVFLIGLLSFMISAVSVADTYTVQNRNLDPAFWSASVHGDNEPQPFLSTVKHLVGANDIAKTAPNTWKPIDTTKLVLTHTYNVRTYFVGENVKSAYGLYLGPLAVFPNASTPVKYQQADHQFEDSLRTCAEPLFPGDFVDLGTINAGNCLDFSLMDCLPCEQPMTPCELVQASAKMGALGQVNNPFMLFWFATTGGNVVFALDVGKDNIKALVNPPETIPSPEPIVLIPVIGAGLLLRRFRRK